MGLITLASPVNLHYETRNEIQRHRNFSAQLTFYNNPLLLCACVWQRSERAKVLIAH
jgi:hypothetical protein